LPPILPEVVEQQQTEKQESDDLDSDTKSSSDKQACHRNPLLMATRSQVSTQFGKTIRNANVNIEGTTIKTVKETLA